MNQDTNVEKKKMQDHLVRSCTKMLWQETWKAGKEMWGTVAWEEDH